MARLVLPRRLLVLFDGDRTSGPISNNVWVQLASSGTILAVSVIILSLVAQGYLLKGLYSGGTKGYTRNHRL
jgi:ABC-type glycerol-3-phosphate transport system permease component